MYHKFAINIQKPANKITKNACGLIVTN